MGQPADPEVIAVSKPEDRTPRRRGEVSTRTATPDTRTRRDIGDVGDLPVDRRDSVAAMHAAVAETLREADAETDAQQDARAGVDFSGHTSHVTRGEPMTSAAWLASAPDIRTWARLRLYAYIAVGALIVCVGVVAFLAASV